MNRKQFDQIAEIKQLAIDTEEYNRKQNTALIIDICKQIELDFKMEKRLKLPRIDYKIKPKRPR